MSVTGTHKSVVLLSLMLLAACIPWPSPLWAGDEDGGTDSPFGLGAGSRCIAMGGAAAAAWRDPYTLFWNPAGICRVERSEASVFHTSLFDESATYSSILFAYPFVDIGVISVGALQLRIGGIEQRDRENSPFGGELENVQTRYVLGYARSVFRGITGGVCCKLDRYVQGQYVANGFGFDAGVGLTSPVRSPVFDGFTFGLALSNLLEPKIRLVSEEAGDPFGARFGFALWRSISRRLGDRLVLSVDFDRKRYADTHLHAGGEYCMLDVFFVRGGWDAGIPTFGCGFTVRFLQLDYAYRSTELGGNHLFSLSYRFGASIHEKLERRRAERDEEMRRELDEHIRLYEDRLVTTSLENGNAGLAAGDYATALNHFKQVLLLVPGNEQARRGSSAAQSSLLVLSGDSLVREAQYTEALFTYGKAFEIVPSEDTRGKMELCERRIGEAEDIQEMVGSIFSRALDLFTEHKWEEAANGFEKVLDIRPGHELAAVYREKSLSRIRLERERVLAGIDRLISEKRFGAALEAARNALESYPGDGELEGRLSLARGLQREADALKRKASQEERKAAALTTEELEELTPVYERGVEFFKRGNFTRAIEEWNIVWQRYPMFEQVREYLIKAYQYKGMELYTGHKYGEALDVWGRILEIDADNEKALRYINRTKEEIARLKGLTG